MPSPFVRPVPERQPSLTPQFSVGGEAGVRSRKIFIIKQVRVQANDPRKKIRRILIFDNHPDSLRLVFGRRADSNVHFSHSERMTSSGVALLWILVVVLMIGMVWPIL
jgi:hypothetical protein